MDTEGNMLSEISPIEKDKYHMISLTFGILKINKPSKNKHTDTENRLSDYQRGRGGGGGQNG